MEELALVVAVAVEQAVAAGNEAGDRPQVRHQERLEHARSYFFGFFDVRLLTLVAWSGWPARSPNACSHCFTCSGVPTFRIRSRNLRFESARSSGENDFGRSSGWSRFAAFSSEWAAGRPWSRRSA